jgi:hypothetical protein
MLIIYLYIPNLLVNILPQCGYAYEIIVSYVNSTDSLSGKRFPFEVKTVLGIRSSSQLAEGLISYTCILLSWND